MKKLITKQKRPTRTKSGTVTIIEACTGDKVIGNGWIFFGEQTGMMEPVLIGKDGKKLEYGFYHLHSKEIYLALMPEMNQ